MYISKQQFFSLCIVSLLSSTQVNAMQNDRTPQDFSEITISDVEFSAEKYIRNVGWGLGISAALGFGKYLYGSSVYMQEKAHNVTSYVKDNTLKMTASSTALILGALGIRSAVQSYNNDPEFYKNKSKEIIEDIKNNPYKVGLAVGAVACIGYLAYTNYKNAASKNIQTKEELEKEWTTNFDIFLASLTDEQLYNEAICLAIAWYGNKPTLYINNKELTNQLTEEQKNVLDCAAYSYGLYLHAK